MRGEAEPAVHSVLSRNLSADLKLDLRRTVDGTPQGFTFRAAEVRRALRLVRDEVAGGRSRPLVTIVEEGVVRRLCQCCGLLGPSRIENCRGWSTE